VQDWANVQTDAAMKPPPVGKDFDGAFGAARRIDGDEAVVGWRPLGVANDQALSMECLTWSLGARTRARSCSAAGKGESGCFGQRQRCAGDAVLQGVQRHALRLPCARSR
jgi:hypothetical protein